ncbi:MAG: ABC transporter permease [Alcaligenaceae bacterium]|nr:ABC transporter permease [Alcaligenaceae bacterium]
MLKPRSSLAIVKAVLFALIMREMRGKIGAKRFGMFWLLFEPMVQIVIMMTIFSLRSVAGTTGFDYPVFLMVGMVPFFLMRNISLKGMEAVSASKALFAYKQIKPFDTILARALVEGILYICVYIILSFILGFWFGYDASISHPLKWLYILGIGLLMSFAMALLYCMLGEMLPEAKTFIRVIYLPIYLLSGVLFPIWILPNYIMDWLLWNPYLHIIDELRRATFEHYPLHYGVNLAYPLKITVVLLLFSLALYRVRRLKLVSL